MHEPSFPTSHSYTLRAALLYVLFTHKPVSDIRPPRTFTVAFGVHCVSIVAKIIGHLPTLSAVVAWLGAHRLSPSWCWLSCLEMPTHTFVCTVISFSHEGAWATRVSDIWET